MESWEILSKINEIMDFFVKNKECAQKLINTIENIDEIRDIYGNSLLHYAAREENTELINLLIEKGADPLLQNERGETPLHWAVANAEVVSLLVKYDVDVKDRDGRTPLHWAVKFGNRDAVEILLRHGASVDATDKYGFTPLKLALFEGSPKHIQIAKLLIEHGADVKSAFHMAVYTGSADLVKLFLEKGADIDAQDNNGDTALHIATRRGYLDVVKVLLEHGANANLRNKFGETPLDIAALLCKEGRLCAEVFEILFRHSSNETRERAKNFLLHDEQRKVLRLYGITI